MTTHADDMSSRTKDELQTELENLFPNEGVHGRIRDNKLLITTDRQKPLSGEESAKFAEWCACYEGKY